MRHDIVEEIRVSGAELVDKVRNLVREGSIRRLVIINNKDEVVFELPLALGVAGVGGAFALAPILSSVAAYALFVNDTRILVERSRDAGNSNLNNGLSSHQDQGKANTHHTRSSASGRDPYEIDVDFEVLD
ncbi:DUF4342 domain-containing protein [Natronogracilivirga saccharolytica]|uniref:DUF4342 domain-containing protein n=1 Tax=Natronogracilivirga saccharolytica TaxID=2812953 RepID=A0A8J7UVY7_9BACT|nr:DUF4342 domain-containing protein [Natronogracilivirga saccharolytica]MBP3191649.1 DUF4342 domain-containing protein [Natronogracilivirga saccharolytica]